MSQQRRRRPGPLITELSRSRLAQPSSTIEARVATASPRVPILGASTFVLARFHQRTGACVCG
jgi:hypothetical protein